MLAGGFVADLTRRHADVAALGYGINACIVLVIGFVGLHAPLIVAMGAAGLLGGHDHAVARHAGARRRAAGAVGRTFGIVTTGFGFGGMVGPLMFGFAWTRARRNGCSSSA